MKDLNDQEVKDLLSDEYEESDLNWGIHTAAIMFSERALPRLLEIMQSEGRSLETRQKAALAIGQIGAESVIEPLSKLQNAGDPKLRELATLALSGINNPKN